MNAQFVHWDHLGSTRVMTDERGAVIASFKYFPFGTEADTGDADGVRLRFAGHERDERVGLDYMMARSYRSTLARFLEPDDYGPSARAESTQTWNRYSYVHDDPVGAIDPTGHAEQLVRSDGDAGPDSSHGELSEAEIASSQTDNDPNKEDARPALEKEKKKDVDADDPSNAALGGKHGGQGKGERKLTGKPTGTSNPRKNVRPDPNRPGYWQVKDPHTKNWVTKSKGWSPDTSKMTTVGATTVGVGIVTYEIVKWVLAAVAAPESGGLSLAAAAATP